MTDLASNPSPIMLRGGRLRGLLRRVTHPGEFLRSVRTLMTGTVFSQVLLIAVSPVLTRLYSPDDFGKLAVFTATCSIIGVFSTLRYHFAIVLAADDDEAKSIFDLCLILTLMTTTVTTIGVFGYLVAMNALNQETRLGWMLLFLPLSVLVGGAVAPLGSWCNRQKCYSAIARGSILQSLTASCINVSAGMLQANAFSLIIAALISQMMNVASLASGLRKSGISLVFNARHFLSSSRTQLSAVAYKFRRFPQFDIWADLSNVASTQVPLLLIAAAFSDSVAGLLVLAQRVVGLPLSFVGNAIGQVFYQRANECRAVPAELSRMLVKLYRTTLLVGLLPTFTLMFFGDVLFALVFGEEWRSAGVVCQFLAPAFLFQFVSSPLSSIFWVETKQRLFSGFCTLLFIGRTASIIVPIMFHAPFYIVAFSYGVVGLALWLGFAILILSQRCQNLHLLLFETLGIVSFAGVLGLCTRLLLLQ